MELAGPCAIEQVVQPDASGCEASAKWVRVEGRETGRVSSPDFPLAGKRVAPRVVRIDEALHRLESSRYGIDCSWRRTLLGITSRFGFGAATSARVGVIERVLSVRIYGGSKC